MKAAPKAWTIAGALALAAMPGCGLHGKPKVERRADAAAARAAAGAKEVLEPDTVVSPGIVEPWGAQVALSAQEAGWIARIDVGEGEAVEAGRLLATLEDSAQRQAVELARAEAAEAEAALARIEHGATADEVREARAENAAAAARAELSRSDAARTRRLHEQGVVADAEADRAASEARALSALAERAEARLAEIEHGARPEDRSAARARAAAARARLRLAEANLARRRVLAPAAGTILLGRAHAGEFYDPAAGPLFLLGDTRRLQVRLEVDEIDAFAVSRGAACAIYSDAGVRLGDGTVFRLAPRMGRKGLPIESPTARSDVRVREVFVEIAPAKLVPGQRVWGHVARLEGGGSPAPDGRQASR